MTNRNNYNVPEHEMERQDKSSNDLKSEAKEDNAKGEWKGSVEVTTQHTVNYDEKLPKVE